MLQNEQNPTGQTPEQQFDAYTREVHEVSRKAAEAAFKAMREVCNLGSTDKVKTAAFGEAACRMVAAYARAEALIGKPTEAFERYVESSVQSAIIEGYACRMAGVDPSSWAMADNGG